MCLISKHLVNKARLKSQTYSLKKPRMIAGLANATVCSEVGLRTRLQFGDGKKREVECIVCDTVPHDLLLGLSFMRENRLSMETEDQVGFTLWDRKRNKKVASTGGRREPGKEEKAFSAGEKQTPEVHVKNQRERLNPEIERAFDSKLRDLTAEQALVGLLKTGEYEVEYEEGLFTKIPELVKHKCYVSGDVTNDVASVPSAAIPWELSKEQRNNLDALVQEYEDIFAAGASDVGAGNFEPVHSLPSQRIPLYNAEQKHLNS